MSQSDVQNKLSKIQSANLSYGEQMKSIDILFKNNLSVRLENHMKTYSSIWKSLRSRYEDISQKTLEKECAEVLANKFSNSIGALGVASRGAAVESRETGCGWRYYLCAGAASAGAILCHGGCETTAIATTAGLGIPACVVACGTLQTYAMVQCADNYCD